MSESPDEREQANQRLHSVHEALDRYEGRVNATEAAVSAATANAAPNIQAARREFIAAVNNLTSAYPPFVGSNAMERLANAARLFTGEEFVDITLDPSPAEPIIHIRRPNDIVNASREELRRFLRAYGRPTRGNLRELRLETCDVTGMPKDIAKDFYGSHRR